MCYHRNRAGYGRGSSLGTSEPHKQKMQRRTASFVSFRVTGNPPLPHRRWWATRPCSSAARGGAKRLSSPHGRHHEMAWTRPHCRCPERKQRCLAVAGLDPRGGVQRKPAQRGQRGPERYLLKLVGTEQGGVVKLAGHEQNCGGNVRSHELVKEPSLSIPIRVQDRAFIVPMKNRARTFRG